MSRLPFPAPRLVQARPGPHDVLRLTPRGVLFRGRRLPCTIGRGGLTGAKREGDGATPRGAHRIVAMLYRADRIARPAPWARPIPPRALWSDDVGDAAYNTCVLAPYGPSHERLRRSDPFYDLILVTDWNWPDPLPGAGSAIFLHRWRRPGAPTEGCVALAPRDLRWLAAHLRPMTPLLVG